MVSSQDIITKLSSHIQLSKYDIQDTSNGCGQCFQVTLVSDDFNGKSTLSRHKMVNQFLKEELKEIHAFSQSTLTVDEYKAKGNLL